MSYKFTKRALSLKPSPMFELSGKVARMREAGQDIISLGIGETDDIDTPLHIKAAAIDAIHDGKTKYTPVDGVSSLKQAICQKMLQDNDLEYNPYQIIVSTGAKQSIHNALLSLVEEGDEVIIFAPYWASYMDNIQFTGAKPIVLSSGIEKQFKISPDEFAQAITDRTRVVILNSPNNPTGAVYTPQELRKIANIIKKHPQIMVISDEIYEHIQWQDAPGKNILNVCPALYDRTIIINGVSKAYAMTGWRIGYAAGPSEVIQQMKKIQSQATSGPCSIAQYAALEALDGNQRAVEQMTQNFYNRHNILFNFLRSLDGCEVLPAEGAYYLFPNITGIITRLGLENDIALAEYILEKAGVSVIPGSVFGMPGYLRISFVAAEDKLHQAIERIQQLLLSSEQ
ncbi:MAG: pyridoxal phosphate-dependent aminotransferase [Pseudomonadota bacterium]|nr:pyridoxal phosphate-dependent aminotransferase [Pseudomonadota bacterium]